MPIVSIVIPVFNGAATIGHTLRSALAQSIEDFEILVVDDGSTDATALIVQGFSDTRIRLLRHPHRGLAQSRNQGIADARSDLIAFLDADDLWTPDKLQNEIEHLQAHPEAALCYSWTCYISEQNALLAAQPPLYFEGRLLSTMILKNLLHCGSNALVRKEALLEVGGFRDDVPFAEDWDCWLRLAANHAFAMVPRYQVLYRQHKVSDPASLTVMEQSNCRTLERALASAPPSFQNLRRPAFANLHQYLAILHLVRRTDGGRVVAAAAHLARACRFAPSLCITPAFWRQIANLGAEALLPAQARARLHWHLRQKRLQTAPELEMARQTLQMLEHPSA